MGGEEVVSAAVGLTVTDDVVDDVDDVDDEDVAV